MLLKTAFNKQKKPRQATTGTFTYQLFIKQCVSKLERYLFAVLSIRGLLVAVVDTTVISPLEPKV